MGCLSTKHRPSNNVYKVTDSQFGIGKLEINSAELVFHKKGCAPIAWSLKHLRRYGVDPDTEIFSIEAGRRCVTGEGVYNFKCPQANDVFEELREHIEGIATSNSVEDILQTSNFPSSPDHLDESLHTLRPRKHPHQLQTQIDVEPDYLEPQPSVPTTTLMHPRAFQIRMMSLTGNMSPDIESSDSLHSIPEFSEQISESPLAHDNNNSQGLDKDNLLLSPGTAGLYINVSTILSPNNTNKSITTTPKSCKSIFFDETIPRNYVNVDIPDSKSTDFIQQSQQSEEDPILSATTIEVSDENATTMNYIVLDLGQDTMSTSTLTSGCATTNYNNSTTKVITTPPSHILTKSLSTGSGISFNSLSGTTLISPESPKTEPFSYATIDFQKTIALASSTLNNNTGHHTLEGVRKTRHDSYGMK